MRIEWQKSEYGGAGFVAKLGDITLYVSPDRVVKFGTEPARGTKWRAGVSSWNERTRTVSRFGRDVYEQSCNTSQEAMKLAEQVYNEARQVAA